MLFRPRHARLVRAVPALCCALSLLGAAPVHAADKVKEGAFGKPKPGSLLLSRSELRECLAQKERVHVLRDETVKLQAQLAQDKEEITRRGDDLKDRLAVLDRASQEAVDKYNLDAVARDKLIDVYEAAVPAFNTKVETLAADRDAFVKNCDNRRYDEKDEQALQRRK